MHTSTASRLRSIPRFPLIFIVEDHGYVGILTKASSSSFEQYAHSKLNSHSLESIFKSERGVVYRISGPSPSAVVDELRKFRCKDGEISVCEGAFHMFLCLLLHVRAEAGSMYSKGTNFSGSESKCTTGSTHVDVPR